MSNNIVGSTLLNQFRVDNFVASGGMGTVFRIYDLKRNVWLAMKVLHSDLAEDPHIFKRFQREARALEKLAHPNIVPFYGLYRSGETIFLMARFIDGPTLKDILKRRQGMPLPLAQTLILIHGVCAALGYAHSFGIIHCDVKPGNVMVDAGGTVYLTDFGVARHAESTTTTLGAAGTPAYMAPEQIRGDPVSSASDVYALGVMLFELLTGNRPFRGDETSARGSTASERIRYAQMRLPPPDPRSLNPNLPAAITTVVLKAMEKDPSNRYVGAQEMFYALCRAAQVDPRNVEERLLLDRLPDLPQVEEPAHLEQEEQPYDEEEEGEEEEEIREEQLSERGAEKEAAEFKSAMEAALHSVRFSDVIKEVAQLQPPEGEARSTPAEEAVPPISQKAGVVIPARLVEWVVRSAEPSAPEAVAPPAKRAAETPAERAVAPPAKRAAETPVKRAAETPVKRAAETPVKGAAETPVKGAAEAEDELAEKVLPVMEPRGLSTPKSAPLLTARARRRRGSAIVMLVGVVLVLLVGMFALQTNRPSTLLADTPEPSLPITQTAVEIASLPAVALPILDLPVDQLKGIYQLGGREIREVRYSPDGAMVAALWRRGVQLYDANSLLPLRYFASTYELISLAFSPDGSLIAAGTTDKYVELWQVENGARLEPLEFPFGGIHALTFIQRQGNLLLAGGMKEGGVKVWDLQTREIVNNISNSPNISALVVSSNARWLAALSGVNLMLWNFDTRQYLSLTGTAQRTSLAYSSDGKWLASGDANGVINIYNSETLQPKTSIQNSSASIRLLAFSPDAQFLASWDADGTAVMWVVASFTPWMTLPGYLSGVNALALAPDGIQAVAGRDDGSLVSIDLLLQQFTQTQDGGSGVITSMAVSPDGNFIWTGLDNGMVRIRKAQNGEVVRDLSISMQPLSKLVFSADGRNLAAGDAAGRIVVWNPEDWTRLDLDTGTNVKVTGLAFLYQQDGAVNGLGYALEDGRMGVYELNPYNAPLWEKKVESGPNCVGFMPPHLDMGISASLAACEGASLVFFDTIYGMRQKFTLDLTSPITAMAASGDVNLLSVGNLLALGNLTGNVRMFDQRDLKQVGEFMLPPSVWGLAFSPDGTRLAVAAGANTVYMFDANSGQQLYEFTGFPVQVIALSFMAGGNQLATLDQSGTLVVWEMP
jgi:serine/threonine protein kinase/WD40 repeat protein